jgi:hypothetical protein
MIDVELKGTATHQGGGCVFSLSYDEGKTFTYQVPLPKEAPSCDSCIFAWSWVPVLGGQPEHFMDCADIKITGGSSGSTLSGIALPKTNMEGGPKFFGNAGGNTGNWVESTELFGSMAKTKTYEAGQEGEVAISDGYNATMPVVSTPANDTSSSLPANEEDNEVWETVDKVVSGPTNSSDLQ